MLEFETRSMSESIARNEHEDVILKDFIEATDVMILISRGRYSSVDMTTFLSPTINVSTYAMIVSSGEWDNYTIETSTFTSAASADVSSTQTITLDAPLLYSVGAVTIGLLGMTLNGVLCFILFCSRKTHKGNVLILNQTILDVVASLLLIVTFATRIPMTYLSGTSGRVYCKLIGDNTMFSTGKNASITGLVVITLERYVKIVHSIFYRRRYSTWLQNVALVFPWIYSIAITFPILMTSSDISDGRCLAASYWSVAWYQQAYGLGTVVWKFLLPLSVFLFCYTKILILIKAQTRVHSTLPTNNVGQGLLARSERQTIKTLMFVVGCYILAYTPFYTYYTMTQLGAGSLASTTYYLIASFSNLNMCINPFIYAINHQGVRVVIQKLRNRWNQRMDKRSTVVPYSIEAK